MRDDGLKQNKILLAWILLLLTTGSAIVVRPSESFAGECTETAETYVAQLASLYSQKQVISGFDVFWCLACYPEDWNLWAGPIAAQRFDECRKSMFRDRIAAACAPFLDDSTYGERYQDARMAARGMRPPDTRMMAAVLLAFYGFDRLGDHDIFLILTSSFHVPGIAPRDKFIALAALRDPRTVPFLSTLYDSLQTAQPANYSEYVAGIVNCDYHIPGKAALELAERIYNRESDTQLRERVYRVIAR